MFSIPNLTKPSDDNQLRVLIIGPPGVGKTWAALTFPNPVILNVERGLIAHRHRTDIQEIALWSAEWRKGQQLHDAALGFLRSKVCKALESDQTLVIDSLTTLQEFFQSYIEPLTPLGKAGKPDKYFVWGEQLKYFRDLHLAMNGLKCHIVSIVHELPMYKEDVLVGYQNALKGSYGEILGKNYTDVFRLHVTEVKTADGDKMKISRKYEFQIQPDELHQLKTRIATDLKFIPATYEAIANLYKLSPANADQKNTNK